MLFSIVIGVLFIGILASLAIALYRLGHDKSAEKGTVRALTVRIGLSVGLFLILMLLIAFDVIKPHGVYPAPPATAEQTGEQ